MKYGSTFSVVERYREPTDMKQVRVLIIDPFKRQIYEKHIGQDNVQEMQAIVGGYIEAVGRYENNDALFVNENGLYLDDQKFFSFKEFVDQPLAGVAFLGGHDDEGIAQDAKMTELDLATKVEWVEPAL